MNGKTPSLSTLVATLGGAAGTAGVICSIVGVSPSSTIGKVVEAIVSVVLVVLSHWHALSVVATKAKASVVHTAHAEPLASPSSPPGT